MTDYKRVPWFLRYGHSGRRVAPPATGGATLRCRIDCQECQAAIDSTRSSTEDARD